jgi:hypothetical protein
MSEDEAIKQIIEAAKVLGWGFMIPNEVDEDTQLRGFVVGDKGYLDYIQSCLDD